MKVLHLPYGGQMTLMCSALQEIGVDATSCHFRQSKLQFKPDVCLNLQDVPELQWGEKVREFFFEAVKEYDVFHFHFGETFFPDRSDLAYLKEMGKKMVVQHRGSDVRILSVALGLGNPYVRVKGGKSRRPEALISNLQQLSTYIDHAIVADHELLPYVQDYYKHVHIIWQAVDLKSFVPSYPSPSNKEPLIVHAPSNAYYKGTEFVTEAIERLQKKGYRFQFQLIENMPHEQALKMYQEADVIIDQLRAGSFGILSLESMALGKPVICYIRDDLLEKYPPKLPIVSANPMTIYENLKKLIKKPQERYQLGIEGRRYVEKYHDSLLIARQLADLYRSL